MSEHEVSVDGCDASTKIKIECTDEQLQFLIMLAKKISKASKYGCEPTMSVDGEIFYEND